MDFRKATFYITKGNLLHYKRQPIALQYAVFYSLKGGILQREK